MVYDDTLVLHYFRELKLTNFPCCFQLIDKKNFLLNVLQKKNLHKLSSEILKVNPFAQGLYSAEKKEQAIQFLICLDFLIKGVLIHWSIKLKEEKQGQGTDIMKGFETKFPLLIGDQYQTMAYFMITRVGNVELTRLLTLIEENFWKIFYNLEKFPADLTANIEFIYEHFYNYLPQFMGNTFNGLGVIFDLDKESLLLIRDAGIDLGFCFQFGIFSYIMTAIINQTVSVHPSFSPAPLVTQKKAAVKEQLQKISSIL